MFNIELLLFLKQSLSFEITRALFIYKFWVYIQRNKIKFLLSKRILVNAYTVFDWVISFWLFFIIYCGIIFLALLLTDLHYILYSLLSKKGCVYNALHLTISNSAKVLILLILDLIWDSLMEIFLLVILVQNFSYIQYWDIKII